MGSTLASAPFPLPLDEALTSVSISISPLIISISSSTVDWGKSPSAPNRALTSYGLWGKPGVHLSLPPFSRLCNGSKRPLTALSQKQAAGRCSLSFLYPCWDVLPRLSGDTSDSVSKLLQPFVLLLSCFHSQCPSLHLRSPLPLPEPAHPFSQACPWGSAITRPCCPQLPQCYCGACNLRSWAQVPI